MSSILLQHAERLSSGGKWGLVDVHVSPETEGEQAEAPKAVLKEGEISARSRVDVSHVIIKDLYAQHP